jgi:hypothetical protein
MIPRLELYSPTGCAREALSIRDYERHEDKLIDVLRRLLVPRDEDVKRSLAPSEIVLNERPAYEYACQVGIELVK